ncbi:Rop guanine nucleotide exchange factor 9 [Hibiscus syriacus]|uniref:Rop guanine nucleotide exchange factor 9 n=1 Tax=Hibiscus syriacus TaxID=106335 RepID=A0A6A3ASH8_HIBSY|nr:Rop guanine nucleotide exchange factor 9 [Hibiscus syriacus]
MLRTITRRCRIRGSSSFKGTKTSKLNHQNLIPDGGASAAAAVTDDVGIKNAEDQSMVQQQYVEQSEPLNPEEMRADMEMMKERFAKLLLGEDMSGGGKGVSSTLALSNAVTNLAGGYNSCLVPRNIDCSELMVDHLSVADHIVELVPAKQTSKDGTEMETGYGHETQSRSASEYTLPAQTRRVAHRRLSTILDKRSFGMCPRMMLKARKAGRGKTNDGIRSLRMKETLGDSTYKSITVEYLDPVQFLAAMDFSTEHKILDFKNRIEASVIIWRRKKVQKDARSSSWGTSVSVGKRELFEERAATVLLILKQHFPGLPQSALDISKIQENKDDGLPIPESYSRVLESLAYSVMSRIEDVLHADSLTRASSSPARSEMSNVDAFRSSAAEVDSLLHQLDLRFMFFF